MSEETMQTQEVEKEVEKRAGKSARKFDFFKIFDVKVFDYTIGQLMMFVIFCAFCGFMVENIGRTIDQGIFDGRYMFLPFIFGYGIGVLIAYLALGRPSGFRIFSVRILKEDTKKNKVIRCLLYYLTAFIIITMSEWGFGTLVEAVTGQKLWNYSNMWGHIGRYASLPTSFGFSSGVFVVMEFLMPPLMKLFEKISNKATLGIAFTLLCLMFADTMYMMIRLFVMHDSTQHWRIVFPWAKEKAAAMAIA